MFCRPLRGVGFVLFVRLLQFLHGSTSRARIAHSSGSAGGPPELKRAPDGLRSASALRSLQQRSRWRAARSPNCVTGTPPVLASCVAAGPESQRSTTAAETARSRLCIFSSVPPFLHDARVWRASGTARDRRGTPRELRHAPDGFLLGQRATRGRAAPCANRVTGARPVCKLRRGWVAPQNPTIAAVTPSAPAPAPAPSSPPSAGAPATPSPPRGVGQSRFSAVPNPTPLLSRTGSSSRSSSASGSSRRES
jgi:hypothetical protein